MNRAKHKGPYTNIKLLRLNSKKKIDIKTKSRNSDIIPKFIGKTLKVYNGKSFSNVTIVDEMIGYKLGEFSATRQKFSFKKKKKK